MTKKVSATTALVVLCMVALWAQPKKATAEKAVSPAKPDSLVIPVSKADLGTFPYFKTIRNYYANDSATIEFNQVYFFDGKKYFTVDGRVSRQKLDIQNRDDKAISEFGCINEFDKIISNLGGIKIYSGKLPEDQLKALAGEDIIALGSKSQIASSAYYGLVEYVIKTPEKEVWIQLEPYSLASNFYTLMVVEKTIPMLSLNSNRKNQILEDLLKTKKSILHISFEPDNATILSASKDEILSLLGVYQLHPDWVLKIDCYTAPVGKADYTLALTEKRASAIKQELVGLGVKDAAIIAKGMGEQKPISTNDTEQGRLLNTRIEISL